MELLNSVILVVEEDWDMLQVICDQLRSAGLNRLLCSQTGEDALDAINNGIIPDMVIINTSLSDINGFSMVETLKKINTDLVVISIVDYQKSITSSLLAIKQGCNAHVGNKTILDKPKLFIETVTYWLEYNVERLKLEDITGRIAHGAW